MGYRDTPHLATGVSSYKVMANRRIRTKLDYTVPYHGQQLKHLVNKEIVVKNITLVGALEIMF